MNVKSLCIPSILIIVITTEITPDSTAAIATVFRIPFISPAPNLCAVITVKPAVSPIRLVMIRNIIVPVDPTAANAFVPTNFPTMIVSAIL